MQAWTLAAAEISSGYIAGAVVVWVIAQVLTGLFSAAITLAVLKHQTRELKVAVEGLGQAVGRLDGAIGDRKDEIAGMRVDQADCRRRASEQFANRSELVRVGVDQTAQWRRNQEAMSAFRSDVTGSLETIHGRITDIVEKVAAIGAAQGGD